MMSVIADFKQVLPERGCRTKPSTRTFQLPVCISHFTCPRVLSSFITTALHQSSLIPHRTLIRFIHYGAHLSDLQESRSKELQGRVNSRWAHKRQQTSVQLWKTTIDCTAHRHTSSRADQKCQGWLRNMQPIGRRKKSNRSRCHGAIPKVFVRLGI
jgi:hypothetical protein